MFVGKFVQPDNASLAFELRYKWVPGIWCSLPFHVLGQVVRYFRSHNCQPPTSKPKFLVCAAICLTRPFDDSYINRVRIQPASNPALEVGYRAERAAGSVHNLADTVADNPSGPGVGSLLLAAWLDIAHMSAQSRRSARRTWCKRLPSSLEVLKVLRTSRACSEYRFSRNLRLIL